MALNQEVEVQSIPCLADFSCSTSEIYIKISGKSGTVFSSIKGVCLCSFVTSLIPQKNRELLNSKLFCTEQWFFFFGVSPGFTALLLLSVLSKFQP